MTLIWLIPALGIAQIIGWGSLYYSLAVLAAPIRADLGFSEFIIFAAFSLGLLISGTAAPYAGRWIDRHGGRRVMATGSAIAAIALLVIASAQSAPVYLVGWMLAGAAMAMCLYDSAFATLHQIVPQHFRRAVSSLTLFGGFASTVFWPLANSLAASWGWRETLVLFAGLHLLVCLPIYLGLLPAATGVLASPGVASGSVSKLTADKRYLWLASGFALATFVFGALSAFVITALVSRGFSMDEAVWIAALIGPMQVTGRIIEWALASRIPASRVGIAALSLMVLAVLLLSAMHDSILVGCLFAAAYGFANGVLTIVRGTVPAELFGAERQGALLGGLARPALLSMAVAPALVGGLLRAGLPMSAVLVLLAAIAAAALGCFVCAVQRKPCSGTRYRIPPPPTV